MQPGSPASNSNPTSPLESWIVQKWQDVRQAYTIYHMMGWDSLLHYCGSHWRKWDEGRKIWVEAVPDDEWTPQPNINRFAPAIDSVASIMQVPNIEAVPTQESNIEAHDVAAVANRLAEHAKAMTGLVKPKEDTEDKGGLAGAIFVLLGTLMLWVEKKQIGTVNVPQNEQVPAYGVQCVQCDTYNKVPMDVTGMTPPPPQVCPDCQGPTQLGRTTMTQPRMDPATGQPMTQPKVSWGVDLQVWNPLYALPRPGAKTMDNLGWTMYAERLDTQDIKAKWGYEATPDNEFVDGMASNYETSLNYFYTGYSSYALQTKDSALVVRVLIWPGKDDKFPDGVFAVWCNNRVIFQSKWEEQMTAGVQSMLKANYLDIPTIFFGRSVAFDMAPIQKELCAYESIIKLHGMTGAAEPIVADENTKISEITGRGDKVIWYRSIGPGGNKPERLRHEVLDAGIYAQRQELKSELDNISGSVSVYRGEQPGSVTTASGIAQLRGQAEQMFSKPHTHWNGIWCDAFRRMVKILQVVMEPWEIEELIGPNSTMKVQLFKNADLDKLLNWITTSAGLPRSRDEKRQELLMLWDRGALDLTDPNVRQRINELFGETGLAEMFNKDATRARMENRVMCEGGQPTFMPEIEDLAVHFSIHSEFIKALDFDKLDTPVKTKILQHAMETKMALAAMQAQQAAIAGPDSAQGSPAGQGRAGGGKPGAGGALPSKGATAHHGKAGVDHAQPSAATTPAGAVTVPTGPNNAGPGMPAPGLTQVQ